MIQDLRRALGFSVDEVAAEAGWPRARQREIEATDDPEGHECDRLSDLLGVDLEAALEAGKLPHHPVAGLLKGSSSTLSASIRFSLAEATSIARELRALQRSLDGYSTWSLVSAFPNNPDYSHPADGTPEKLADHVRSELGLGSEGIASVAASLLRQLDVLVLWAQLPDQIDAVSFAQESCGAVIVANLAGSHMGTAFGRRVTWTHEVCHLLFDRPQMRDMRRFCSIARTRKPAAADKIAQTEYEIERRARAFAAYLLAPRDDFERFWRGRGPHRLPERVRAAMERYGMGYEATRAHLSNLGLLPMRRKLRRVPTDAPDELERRDPWPTEVEVQARELGLPPMRCGAVLATVRRAYREGALSEEGVRDFLRVPGSRWPELVGNVLSDAEDQRVWRSSAAHVAPWL